MSRFIKPKHPSRTVRPRLGRKTSMLFCLLMAVLAAWSVYRWGYGCWTPTDPYPTHTATAYVVEQLPGAAEEVRTPIAFTDADPQRAEEVANVLADCYVEDRRLEWMQRTEGPCRKAREAVEKARRELRQNEARLEEFRNELASVKPQAAEPRKPLMIDNREWLDLDDQLEGLQERRASFLINLTPLHPTVREVDLEIDEVKQQLAETPRQIPGKLPSPFGRGAGGEGSKTSVPFSTTPAIAEKDRAKLSALNAAVQTSLQAYDEAGAAEKKALEAQQTGPRYAAVYAEAVEIAPTTDYGWRRLIATTLMAGVLMAFGVGTITAGVGIDPPVGSVGQVRTAAHAPVLGTIPADDPVSDPEQRSRRASRKRRMLIALGAILIAVCPVAAAWGIAGI